MQSWKKILRFVKRKRWIELEVVMAFSRPSCVPFPSVWHRFTVCKDGVTIPMRVQDLTEDLKEPALALLETYFTRDEPPCKYIQINKHPSALMELKKLWRKAVEEGISLVCVVDDEGGELVGTNVLAVACRGEDEGFHTEDKIWAKLFGAVDAVSRGADVFSLYGVDRYLTAYGLVVDPKWRGHGIGTDILKARIPLCKALGLKVTATVFTAAASQAVAKKAGFETLFEITYSELAAKGYAFPNVEEDTKSSKLMALKIE